jgi:hypothetical protein
VYIYRIVYLHVLGCALVVSRVIATPAVGKTTTATTSLYVFLPLTQLRGSHTWQFVLLLLAIASYVCDSVTFL